MTSPVIAGRNQPPPPDPDDVVDPDDFPDLEELPINVASAPGSTPSLPTSGGSFANTTETISLTGSGVVFVNSYGANVSATFRNEIVAAENYFQTHFTNTATINVSFNLAQLSPQVAGQNSFTYVGVSYSAFVSALQSHATSADDLAAVNALTHLADPSGGHAFVIPLGEANILGLYPQYAGNYDSVTLNSLYYTSTALQNDPNDVIAVLEHEISEGGMGRIGGLWGPMDLFRFTASGARDFTGGRDGQPTYFSPDGTNVDATLQYHNPINAAGHDDGEDWADWDQVGADARAHDPFGPGGPGAGDPGQLSNTDLRIMDVLGWTRTPVAGAVANDFNGDGMSDILTKNNSSGSVAMIEMNGTQVLSQAAIGGGGGWSVTATGDFNGDGKSGILWQNSGNGAVLMYEMNGTQVIGQTVIGGGGGWSVVATGDFNGDGKTDVAWQNSNGSTLSYEMNGTQVIGIGSIGGGAGWSVAGTGDFNGDGKTDILWKNNASGGVVMDEINGTAIVGQAPIGGGGGWSVVATGDFNGDGKSDILWQNSGTGPVLMYEMNGTQMIGQAVVGGGGGWSVVATGDFNSDGKSDIVWQNTASGAAVIYEMSGTQVIAQASVGGGAGTSFAGVGDYNGDGKSDLLWKSSTGTVQMYEMNGTQVLTQTSIAIGGNSSTIHNSVAGGTLVTS